MCYYEKNKKDRVKKCADNLFFEQNGTFAVARPCGLCSGAEKWMPAQAPPHFSRRALPPAKSAFRLIRTADFLLGEC
jgi:hypothetical protein